MSTSPWSGPGIVLVNIDRLAGELHHNLKLGPVIEALARAIEALTGYPCLALGSLGVLLPQAASEGNAHAPALVQFLQSSGLMVIPESASTDVEVQELAAKQSATFIATNSLSWLDDAMAARTRAIQYHLEDGQIFLQRPVWTPLNPSETPFSVVAMPSCQPPADMPVCTWIAQQDPPQSPSSSLPSRLLEILCDPDAPIPDRDRLQIFERLPSLFTGQLGRVCEWLARIAAKDQDPRQHAWHEVLARPWGELPPQPLVGAGAEASRPLQGAHLQLVGTDQADPFAAQGDEILCGEHNLEEARLDAKMNWKARIDLLDSLGGRVEDWPRFHWIKYCLARSMALSRKEVLVIGKRLMSGEISKATAEKLADILLVTW